MLRIRHLRSHGFQLLLALAMIASGIGTLGWIDLATTSANHCTDYKARGANGQAFIVDTGSGPAAQLTLSYSVCVDANGNPFFDYCSFETRIFHSQVSLVKREAWYMEGSTWGCQGYADFKLTRDFGYDCMVKVQVKVAWQAGWTGGNHGKFNFYEPQVFFLFPQSPWRDYCAGWNA